ncbi:GNAT family N-acetyltransferase [Aliiroseovarius sp. YM-037]|uniref:GNAT family N-acetyltransferase n=1 Tax=Aliiroseovarius sp. YM-037 TaxID=3341728 RepID=UPI003A802839
MHKFTAPPVLETDRLRLRGHRADDFDESAAMWADLEVVRYITGEPSTESASWYRLLRYVGHWPVVGYGYWVVEAKDDGRFVGEVGFADYKRDIQPSLEGMPEAGWGLKGAEHGKGYASEAVQRIVAWADTALCCERTACILDPEHAASIRVAEKAGYETLTLAELNGQPTLIMARTRPATS